MHPEGRTGTHHDIRTFTWFWEQCPAVLQLILQKKEDIQFEVFSPVPHRVMASPQAPATVTNVTVLHMIQCHALSVFILFVMTLIGLHMTSYL